MKFGLQAAPTRLSYALALALLVTGAPAWAQSGEPLTGELLRQQELLREQEHQRQLREQQEQQPDVRVQRPPPVAADSVLPRQETPCFRIQRITLTGELAERFEWALGAADPAADPASGACLGTAGINVVIARVQDAIIARGYVTTRVLAAPQDLTTGTLALTVIPGRIRTIGFADAAAARATIGNAMPAQPGDVLNLRDIEQALENLQRVPTVVADIQIVPAAGDNSAPGQSDLMIAWQQSKRWRGSVSLDDSGSRATGKGQASVTASLDNLLGINDLFYVNYGHDVFNGNRKGTENWTVHYEAPADYWLLGATVSRYDYRQTEVGPFERFVYSGGSRNAEVRAARILFRNAKSKFGLYARGWWRASANYVNDAEIQVQRRRMGGWELGLTHKQFIGSATLEASAGYRRGAGAFDALQAPEELFGEGTSRMKLIIADAQFRTPLRIGQQALSYTASLRGQWNRTALVPQDRFAIGGRYTVRGFDGELSLIGERGWLLRNDVGLALGGGQEFYLGIDHGRVAGPSTARQLGRRLTGMALGLRGGWRSLAWDVFVGAPLSRPQGFPTPYATYGMSLNSSF